MGTEPGPAEGTASAGSGRSERPPEFRTFLIADIRGYTAYTDAHGDEAAATLAARFAELARAVVEARDGILLELRGDEALTVFGSARQALRAAIELQDRFTNEKIANGVGIGLDTGEAVPVQGGYRGTALNVAARLCAQAGAGQILASETVVRLAARIEGIRYTNTRSLRLKGLESPIRVVGVLAETAAVPRQRPTAAPPRSRAINGRIAVFAAVAAVFVLAAAGLGVRLSQGSPQASSGASASSARGSGRPASATAGSSASVAPSPTPEPAADVPMSLGFLSRDGIMPGPGPEAQPKPPTRRWQFQANADMGQAPAVADGMVYVGDLGGTLHVLDIASGKEQWSYAAGAPIQTTSAVAGGAVYVTSHDGVFHAIDLATHQRRWQVSGVSPDAIPTVVDDVAYLGLSTGRFEAVAITDGAERWHVDVAGDASLNAIEATTAFVASRGSDRIYGIDLASHTIRWQTRMGGTAVVGPAVFGNSVFIVAKDSAGQGNRLLAFDTFTGRQAWTWASPDRGSLNSLTVTNSYVFTSSGSSGSTTLWAVDRISGQLAWPRQLKSASIKPTIVGQRLYVASGTTTRTGTVAAVEVASADDLEVWNKQIGGVPVGGPVVTGGLVLVATAAGPTDRGSLWAIGDESGAPVSGPDAWEWVADLTAGDNQPALYLDVALDQKGNVYAPDRFFNRVVIWDKSGKPTTWGKFGSGPGEFDFGGVTPGDASQSVGIAPDGRIAVGDGGNHRVQIFDSRRQFIRSVGRLGRSPGRFVNPCCVAFDPQGRLYVADPGRNDIQVFDKNGKFIRIIGSEGSGDGQFSRLGKPYIDPTTGLLWVPNFGNKRVEVMAPDGTFVASYGRGRNGDPVLAEVNGVVLDSAGRMFIVDTDNFLWILDSGGKFIARLGPEIPDGHGFIAPPYLALSPDGKLYLPEAAPGANRVVVLQLLPPLWPPP